MSGLSSVIFVACARYANNTEIWCTDCNKGLVTESFVDDTLPYAQDHLARIHPGRKGSLQIELQPETMENLLTPRIFPDDYDCPTCGHKLNGDPE